MTNLSSTTHRTVLALTTLKVDGDPHDVQMRAVNVVRAMGILADWKIEATLKNSREGSRLTLTLRTDDVTVQTLVWPVLYAAFPIFRGYSVEQVPLAMQEAAEMGERV